MNTAVFDFARIGLVAVAFILLGKWAFTGYNVPVLGKVFAAV